LRRLEQEWFESRRHPLFPPGHFTIGPDTIAGTLHGQTFSWAVANECRLEYLVMYEPGREQSDVRAEIEAHLGRVYDADPWLREHRPEIAWTHTWPPYDTPVDHPITRAVQSAHGSVVGAPVELQGFSAVDDATYFERRGIAAVSYGPGSILTCHCYDESVSIDELIAATRVYAATAIDWCGLA
jgi:acetylornithine deacetylase